MQKVVGSSPISRFGKTCNLQVFFVRSVRSTLYEIADQHPRLRIIPIRKSSLGRLTVDDIEGVNPSVWNGHVYICGPPAMIDNMRSGFAARGIPPERIHSETLDFRARARAWRVSP